MNDATRYLAAFGRALIGAIFVLSGVGKLAAYGATTAGIIAVGLPFPPLAYATAVIVEVGVGLLLLIGFQARAAALVLAIWCVVTAAFFHSHFADQNAMIHFLKNLMIAGGLLQIVYHGAGALSVDGEKARA
jgi:putative oxidoreductase